jgi:uncharacterized protein (TIGR04255 family)
MQYKTNYLRNVIFRIDFSQQLLPNKKSIDSFYNLIKGYFPKREVLKGKVLHTQIVTKKDGNKVTQQEQNVTNYKFSDENQTKILMLEPLSNINLVFNVYKNSEELKNTICLIIDAAIQIYGDIEIKRTGLRYINDIYLSEGNPFDWAPFINDSLITGLNFPPENRNLSRSMGIIELIRDDHSVLFQYGMYNPEYPNKIARKIFVLDYDCYIKENLNASEINKKLEILQKDEEYLFESSIKEGLREKMGVEIDDRKPN